jgi:hypothetical protein
VTNVAQLEPWLTKKQLAERLGCGIRFLGYRMTEGLPHPIAGRMKFRQSEAEAWLEAHGHPEHKGDGSPQRV